MKWVKSSERLPGKEGRYHTKHLPTGTRKLSWRAEMEAMPLCYEWLDESLPEQPPTSLAEKEIERLKGLIRKAFDKSNMWIGQAKESIWEDFKTENNID